MTSTHQTDPSYRRIAWDRVSFCVPEEWELTSYRWPDKGQTRIELEDDCHVCLTGEWQWSDNPKVMKEFLKGLEARNGKLSQRADHKVAVEGLSGNWSAFVYHFNRTVPNDDKSEMTVDKQQVFDATYTTKDFAASFQIRRSDGFRLSLEEMGQAFVKDFQLHTGATVPWELFDVAIDMPKEFILANAQIGIGSKELTFEREKRTFKLWFLSCADVLLNDADSLEKWCCGFLNSQAKIRSMVFKPTTTGGVVAKRRFPMMISHMRDLSSWCFKWKVSIAHDKERNRIVIWVYHYRKKDDLRWLPDWLKSDSDNA